MIHNVLVPLDGSELAEQALAYAEAVVAPGGRVTLVSVIEIPAEYEYALMDVPLTMMTSSARMDDDAYEIAYKRTESYLNTKANLLRVKGYEVDLVIEAGVPAEVIVEQAEALKVNAIVMCTHGRTGFSRWLFGSVTQKVISSMPCPVMVVPGIVPEKSKQAAADTKPAKKQRLANAT